MAVLTLREHLIVDYPGEALPMLQQLATFERIGRLRPGHKRTVENFRVLQGGQQIWLPRGLFPYVVRLLPGSIVRDERLVTRSVSFGFRGVPRDYQAATVAEIVRRDGGVVVAPPASGKTFIGLHLVAEWGQPALFLVHTLRLVHQTEAKARELLTLPRGGLGIVADSHKRYGTHLTIATVQTLASKPRYLRELRGRMGTIVQDEAHHSPANSFQQVLSAFPARYRAALTATPDREDGLGGLINALFGSSIVIPRTTLRGNGIIIDPTIYFVYTHWTPPDDVPYHVAEEARSVDAQRNIAVAKVAATCRARGERVLILVEREKHAGILAQILSQMGVAAHPVTGRTPKPVQDQRFRWMERGQAVAVATKLANEGLDWPALDTVLLAASGRSGTILEQRTGRASRTAPGKSIAKIYDFIDDGPLYGDQTQARILRYREMGYRIRRFQWPTK